MVRSHCTEPGPGTGAEKWISIYYAELFVLQGTGTGAGTRNGNGKFSNGFFIHFSGPASPVSGPSSVQCGRAIREGASVWVQIVSFSCRFWGKSPKIIGWRLFPPIFAVADPSSGKFWIQHYLPSMTADSWFISVSGQLHWTIQVSFK